MLDRDEYGRFVAMKREDDNDWLDRVLSGAGGAAAGGAAGAGIGAGIGGIQSANPKGMLRDLKKYNTSPEELKGPGRRAASKTAENALGRAKKMKYPHVRNMLKKGGAAGAGLGLLAGLLSGGDEDED
jgi:hypothetical protein